MEHRDTLHTPNLPFLYNGQLVGDEDVQESV